MQEARVEIITPKKAITMLKRNTRNRKLSVRTVNYYAEQMKRGDWILTSQGITVSEEGNILDGQHRLSAVVKAGVDVQFFVFYDMEDKSFDRYDVGKTRSAGDIFFIAGIKNANNISAMIKYYHQLTMRDKQAEYSVVHLGLTRHQLLDKYNEGPDFWQEIHKIASRGWSHLRLYNIGFLGGFLAHVVLDKGYTLEQVEKFSKELHGMTAEHNGSTFNLRTTLIRDAMSQKRYTPSIKRAFLTKCWNAYHEGRHMKKYLVIDGEKWASVIPSKELKNVKVVSTTSGD